MKLLVVVAYANLLPDMDREVASVINVDMAMMINACPVEMRKFYAL